MKPNLLAILLGELPTMLLYSRHLDAVPYDPDS